MDRTAMQRINRALRGARSALDSGEIYALVAKRAWRDARVGTFGGHGLEGAVLETYLENYRKANPAKLRQIGVR